MDNGIDNGLSCPICCERYGTPKALPCLHTFCIKCLRGMQTRDGFRRVLTCPLCNVEHRLPGSGVDGFSTNYALNDVVNDLKSPKFREELGKRYKAEEVEAIVRREVKDLKHLVDVVHTPLLQSFEALKKGALQQQKEKVRLVADLYDRIIAHAEREREKHVARIQQNGDAAMKYFNTVESEIQREQSHVQSFCKISANQSDAELESMDLNTFLNAAAELSRGGRRIATDHSHLMWTDVDIAEGKDPVRLIHSSLATVVRVQSNKRSHRPRIGTMENGKNGRPLTNRQLRSKSEPNRDAIEAACLPKVDRKKLSDPVRNVVDSVLHKFRNNNSIKENLNVDRRNEMNKRTETTPMKTPVSPPASAKRSLFAEPPPYPNRRMRRSKSEEEPITAQNTTTTEATPMRTSSTQSARSISSGNSHSSGTPSVQGPSKPPRSSTSSGLQSPCGISITTNDELVIAERGTGLILVTQPRSLRVQRTIKPFRGHVDEAKVHALFDITVLTNGDIAVTDSSLKKVIFLKKFNNYAAPQQVWMPHDMVPRGITSDASCMYICDAGNGCIQVYTHTGKHCSSIELDHFTASDRSELVSEVCPQSIAVSANGHILVTDIINRCIYRVLRTGEISRHSMRFAASVDGVRCNTPPSEAVPRGVCWLDSRHAFIVEDISQEVLLIEALTMVLVRVFRRRDFASLQSMVLDSAGQLLVTDIDSSRIHLISRAELSSGGRGRDLSREPPTFKRSKSLPTEEFLDTLV